MRATPSQSVGIVVCVALVAVAAVLPAAGVTDHPGTDNTVTRIEVDSDGSATWIVQIRTRLDSDEDVATYESFRDRFRENRSAYLGPYRDRMSAIVEAASNDTGRPMAASNFTARTSIQQVPRRWGIVTYEFDWDGFARREGDAVAVGDVFGNGLFIAENDTLQVVGPDGYATAAVEPSPDERLDDRLVWEGRRDFTDGQPSARFEPAVGTDGRSSGFGWPAAVGLLVGAAVLAVGGAVAYRRYGLEVESLPLDAGATSDDEGAPSGDGEREASAGPEPSAESGPVTDRERIRRLLADRDGQMKQSEIVDAVDWSKSKVSRVTAKLEEEGVVEKTRIGRENVVQLREE